MRHVRTPVPSETVAPCYHARTCCRGEGTLEDITFAQALAIHADGGRKAVLRAVECPACVAAVLAVFGQD